MDELAADAPTIGKSLTVTVNGTDAETQPVVLFLTTNMKSYTPATTEVCLLTEYGEIKAAFVMVENPAIALTPAVSVNWSGLPVEEKFRLKLLLPSQTETFEGATVGAWYNVDVTMPVGVPFVQ